MAAAPFDIGSYIEVDPSWHDGWPYIRGTKRTVATVAGCHQDGMSAAEIAHELYLTLPQVHAALCYFLSNREAIEEAVTAADEAFLRNAAAARTRLPVA
ncbi:MAG: DUF433 domain-containing protein [Dehalococcoidia bacterium]